MGRPRKHNKNLPARVYKRGPSYYYADYEGVWHNLGRSEPEMLRALAELKTVADRGMKTLVELYRQMVLPKKADGTRKMQTKQLDTIARVFGHMRPDQIRPVHVAQFHDKRGESAPVTANRELALLSHVMRYGIRRGYCETNPCSTIQRHPEKPRQRYVTDAEYNAVWEVAPAHIRVLMDLAYLTGQRQGDLLALKRDQLKDDGLHFNQAKTGRGLIIAWSPALRAVIEAAQALSLSAIGLYVVSDARGQGYKSSSIQTAWQRLMKRCLKDGVLTERFTFHDLRGKAGTDADDGRLLGHMSQAMLERVYRRKPQTYNPVR